MKVLLDTSVLVPALTPALPNHAAAYEWIAAARDGRVDAIMSWHAFAEAWSVLTRLPLRPPPSPLAVEESLASIETIVRRKSLDGRSYLAASRRCAERGLRSGALFDALHLICAEREGARAVITDNVKDFERLVVPDGPRIVSMRSRVGEVAAKR